MGAVPLRDGEDVRRVHRVPAAGAPKRPASRVSVGVASRTSAPDVRIRTTASSRRAARRSRSTAGRRSRCRRPSRRCRVTSTSPRRAATPRRRRACDRGRRGSRTRTAGARAPRRHPGGGRGGRPTRRSGRGRRVRVGHPLGEGVADGDVTVHTAGDRHQGDLQSTGSAPCRASRSLARLNGRDPKNPACADSGLGARTRCTGCRVACGTSPRASPPQSTATRGPPAPRGRRWPER